MIRFLLSSDISSVIAIAQMTMPYSWPEPAFHDCLNYYGWVSTGEKSENILGFMIVLMQFDECELLNIAVRPEFQRQGLGSQLLEHAIQFVCTCKFKRIMLEVRKSNQRVISLNRKYEFTQIGIRHECYPTEKKHEDALIFGLGRNKDIASQSKWCSR